MTARRIELPSKKMPCRLVSKKYRVTPHPRSGMSHGPRRRGRSMPAAACSGRYSSVRWVRAAWRPGVALICWQLGVNLVPLTDRSSLPPSPIRRSQLPFMLYISLNTFKVQQACLFITSNYIATVKNPNLIHIKSPKEKLLKQSNLITHPMSH